MEKSVWPTQRSLFSGYTLLCIRNLEALETGLLWSNRNHKKPTGVCVWCVCVFVLVSFR